MSGINDLFSGMHAASSALSAERTRIDVISKNIANAETTRMPDGSGPYRRQMVQFAPVLERALDGSTSAGGLRVGSVTKDMTTPFQVINQPGHPDPDPVTGNGLMPNVNVVSEMADLILAIGSYEANLNPPDNFVKMAN